MVEKAIHAYDELDWRVEELEIPRHSGNAGSGVGSRD
jgi:hypothetical protein